MERVLRNLFFPLLLTFVVLPFYAGAQVPNPLPYNTLPELIAKSIGGISLGVGFVATGFTVFAGARLIVAGSTGNEESIKKGRNAVTWALVGFTLILLSFTIVSGVVTFLGASQQDENAQDGLHSTLFDKSEELNKYLPELVLRVMKNTLTIGGGLAVLGILINSLRFMMASGNEEETNKAKSGLKWSAIGFAIMLLAFTLVSGVNTLIEQFFLK